ncbi:Star-like 16 [Homarus americanus]|uniref:Star-like 16 n=2 Tax=Homarus americanus TaxID=6706 RepID=A0A8J5MMG4_HOMAM|nr:Star-like 16 [Homarus americanus]
MASLVYQRLKMKFGQLLCLCVLLISVWILTNKSGTTQRLNEIFITKTSMDLKGKAPQPERVLTDATYQGAAQDDPALVTYVRHLMKPPSTLPYNLTHPEKQHFSQYRQTQHADATYFHGKREGFFVEVGAVDGETFSNSLYLERNLGWSGLLIEVFQITYKALLQKHRKAYSINAALSFKNCSTEVGFVKRGGKLAMISRTFSDRGERIQAIPLYTMLLALNTTVIDFFSLDIEGGEMKVLMTIPWDKVKVGVLVVESNIIPEGRKFLVDYMTSKGYKFIGHRGIDSWFILPELVNQYIMKH